MLILGLSDSHDASVALVENGKILAAVSEERFTRRKGQQGFPYRSLEYVKNFIQDRDVERVYVSGKYGRGIFRVLDFIYSRGDPCKDVFSLSSKIAYWVENIIATTILLKEVESRVSRYAIKRHLKKAGIKFTSVELLNHHYSHVASALTGMNSKNFLAVSLDAYGDGKSGLVISVEDKKVVKARWISYSNSIAQFYAHICAYLGFKEGEEGKAMALADFGTDSELIEIFRKFFNVDGSGIKVDTRYKKSYFLRQLRNYSKPDVAFALQTVTEEITVGFIKSYVNANNNQDLFLSGGFFANVKVNQCLHETELFKRIFVFPNMGDGGTSFISIIQGESRNLAKCVSIVGEAEYVELKDVYLGPEYTDEYIKNILNKNNLDYSEAFEIERKVASLLAEGKVLARFWGRMEYGPRALGNRSILYQTTDKSVNDWLNKKLKRAEFMPFAPVTLFEFKDKCYKNIDGAQKAAKFMTISVDCTEWMKKISPGVVHIDGTARPQLIAEEDNPSFYKILKEYHKITGIPSLINTSFNMHGEPIVCSPQDAIQTFNATKINYLAIGKFLVKNPF